MKLNKIHVIDDFLSKSYIDSIADYVENKYPFYFLPSTISDKNGYPGNNITVLDENNKKTNLIVRRNPGLSSNLIGIDDSYRPKYYDNIAENNIKYFSYFFNPAILSIQDYLKREIRIQRAKVNLTLRTHSDKNIIGVPHLDNNAISPDKFTDKYSFQGMIAILYLNNSDGDTYVFDTKIEEDKLCFDSEEEFKESLSLIDDNSTVRIVKRVTPKKNRLLLFPGTSFHAASTPTENEYRFVINMNFLFPRPEQFT
tara:strand:+ start:1154 stop:1918 length:765 start_codon:yes stop_codon:yes gene_type:complete